MAPEHRRLRRYSTMSSRKSPISPSADTRRSRVTCTCGVRMPCWRKPCKSSQQWGFTYKTNIVWYKIRKDGGPDGRGVGFYFRNVTEVLLFGVKGALRTLKPGRTQVNVLATRKQNTPESRTRFIGSSKRAARDRTWSYPRRDGWVSWGDQVETYLDSRPCYPPYTGPTNGHRSSQAQAQRATGDSRRRHLHLPLE